MNHTREEIEELLEKSGFRTLPIRFLNPDIPYEDWEAPDHISNVILDCEVSYLAELLLYKLHFAPETCRVRFNKEMQAIGAIDNVLLPIVCSGEELFRIRTNIQKLKRENVQIWSPFNKEQVVDSTPNAGLTLEKIAAITQAKREAEEAEERKRLEAIAEEKRKKEEQQRAVREEWMRRAENA
ncbi:MAG: hypothetical protein AAFO82_18540 [Bacteroidota bacterium]